MKPDLAMTERWLERYPMHADLLEALVSFQVAAAEGKPGPELVPVLERYAAARPVDPLPHKLMAKIYLGLKPGETIEGKTSSGAVEHLEYLDAREQGSATYAAELARLYAQAGEWAKAAAKAERATTVAPFDADYRELAATIAIQHADYAAAVRHITALTRIEPDREIHRKRLEAVKRLMEAGKAG